MKLKSALRKIGNSLCAIFPAQALSVLGWQKQDKLLIEVDEEEQRLIVTKDKSKSLFKRRSDGE